jgi:hypothetical protein
VPNIFVRFDKTWIFSTDLNQRLQNKLNENTFSGIGFDTTGQTDTDKYTDRTKPKSAIRALKAPKKDSKSDHNDKGFIIHQALHAMWCF